MEINKNNFEQFCADFLDNKLSDSEIIKFHSFLSKNEELKIEFEELKNLWFQIELPQDVEPSPEMDTIFYDFLNEKSVEKIKPKWYKSSYFKYAASFLGIIGSYFLGVQNTDSQKVITKIVPQKVIIKERVEVPVYETKYIVKIKKVKEKVFVTNNDFTKIENKTNVEKPETNEEKLLSLIGKTSASERIQAVNYSYEINNPDEIILKTLIYTLDYDLNVNVRMAAADAIARFGNYEIVRNALVKSLLKQQEPQLQISIIELLTNLHEKRAIPAFRLLVDDDTNDEKVRNKAQKGKDLLML